MRVTELHFDEQGIPHCPKCSRDLDEVGFPDGWVLECHACGYWQSHDTELGERKEGVYDALP